MKKIVLDIGIFILLLLTCFFIYYYSYSYPFFLVCILLTVVSFGYLCNDLLKIIRSHTKELYDGISRLILVDENDEMIKEWHINGEQSILIGRSYKNQPVDIDLSQEFYAVLIAREHAVMNFVQGEWYLEDLGSINGTAVKSEEVGYINKLTNKPYKLRKKDTIYIGKTKLIVI